MNPGKTNFFSRAALRECLFHFEEDRAQSLNKIPKCDVPLAKVSKKTIIKKGFGLHGHGVSKGSHG